ncbi:MAG: hypothetical protein ACD_2C00031G0003 [uncultured bacterium (gcode 4)]|uniref:Uncharacterized protein n=1 Tax=uncultured bacterium (gcode 4) TaxID=1234023 RepID=K2G777_9BACT|nr:MAG: hypothetical protein ACD_2C00031G0003 [uncultured bacterium (gcode 4)]
MKRIISIFSTTILATIWLASCWQDDVQNQNTGIIPAKPTNESSNKIISKSWAQMQKTPDTKTKAS